MKNDYYKFLERKKLTDISTGFKPVREMNSMLFLFQKDIIKWSLIRGRSAVFADCGLGKTAIQLEWANHVYQHIKSPILIFAPLAVSRQTKREGEKFKIKTPIKICRKQSDIINGINITNYEMFQHFKPEYFGGLILDESSILKGYDGKFRKNITEFANCIPYRLACTATPAPNDLVEIINHAEFLGIMNEKEIKALFFTNRSQEIVQKWVLKKHAINDFWKWMASWSVALRMPSDLGYENSNFILPKLNIKQLTVSSFNNIKTGQFFNMGAFTLKERQDARRNSIDERVKKCVEIVNGSNAQWLIWCDLNKESELLTKAIKGAVEVKGADSLEHKEKSIIDFQSGKLKILVTKPSIAGHGMNLQNCHNMVFVGLSDSYEKLYQATRRCWRFGQKHEVTSYHIVSENEGAVVKNIERKEAESTKLFNNIIKRMNGAGQVRTKREEMTYMEKTEKGKNWELVLGDSILTIDKIKSNSIGLTIFSPPFPGMYTYTNSKHDLGNTKTIDELISQFEFLIPKLLRITMPGRSCCIHLTQGISFKSQDGFMGIKDFRGRIISSMENAGWIYYGEACIDKDPQIKAIRTKDRGLLFKSLSNDASVLHMGGADYLLQFKKHGDNPKPIKAGISKRYKTNGWITSEEWIEWAAPVWYRQTKHYPGGIRETDVLSARNAKDKNDEKHLCPLQLGVIERAIKLWSNPGEIIYSPFAGIGSEGYVALKLEREFMGCELKESYFNQAIKNLKSVKKSSHMFNIAQAI